MNTYLLAVDIGTTSTKGLAVLPSGEVIQSHQCFYGTSYPEQGYAEQNPLEILDAVKEVIRTVSKKAGSSPTGICFSSAMHSLVAVDSAGKPITPLIIWADTRSSTQAAKLKSSSEGNLIYQRTGTPIHPMSPLCKILWWKENQPEVIDQAYKFISIKEFVIHALSGEFIIDHSIASATGLFDIHSLHWLPESLRLCDIREEQLSSLVPTNYTCFFKPEVAKELSVKPDTHLVVGASDGCLAQLGSAAMSKGDITITLGTSGAVRTVGAKGTHDPQQRLFNYLLDEKTVISGGATNNGTVLIDWFNKAFQTPTSLSEFAETISSIPAGNDGLIALPYLLGERATIYNPDARGVFFGVSVLHTKQHFQKAILEGICFQLMTIVQSVESVYGKSARIFVSGGITHAPLWVQLLSNVLGRELIVSASHDASSMGATMLGYRALGIPFRMQENTLTRFTPDLKLTDLYKKQFDIFELLYRQLEKVFVPPDNRH